MNTNSSTISQERVAFAPSGWIMLPTLLVLLVGDIALLIFAIKDGTDTTGQPHLGLLLLSILLLSVLILLLTGFYTLQPNEGRVLVLFGDYKGTVRTSGFHWGNPFYTNGPGRSGLLAQAAAMQSAMQGKVAGTKAGSGAGGQ